MIPNMEWNAKKTVRRKVRRNALNSGSSTVFAPGKTENDRMQQGAA